jgi:dihydroorotate dehydrogenase electron transfer subunit
MTMIQGSFPIVKITLLAEKLYDLYVRCPIIANTAKPGQFILIRVEGFPLRRPIAVCEADRNSGILRLVFGIRGDGTKKLSQIGEGDWIDVLGPLGNGFQLLPGKKAVFVGGGLGVPPLLEAAKSYGSNAEAILGFQTDSQVALRDDFQNYGVNTTVMTDDGSQGRKGLVTDSLEELLARRHPDILYACGPLPMLKTVASIAAREKIRCQVLMEEKMGCGVGACHVCVCRTKRPEGGTVQSRVCSDGPVFEAERVVF